MAQNDWKIGLLGGLDGTRSRSQLNSDIKGLAKSLDKLKIYTELDPNQAKQLKQQMKTLQIELNNVTVSDAAINGLVTSINNKLKGIQIPNITIGGTGNNNTLSRQLGDNTAKLNAFKDSLKNIGMADSDIDRVAKRIERLGVQINSLGQSTLFKSGASGNREFLNVEIDGIDKFGQAVKLTEQWDLELGTLVKSIDAVSTAQEKASSRVDNFASKQKNAVSNLTNQINQLSRAANDPNAARPISETNHLTQLSDAYNEIISSIQKMGNASNATFTDEQNNVRALISNYKSMVSEFRNAENVSTKMKGMDFASGLTIAKNDLEKFKAEAKDFPQILQTIQKLDTAITHVGDASSLNSFNDQLRVARSELAKFKSETNAANKNEKVGINISGLQSKISDLQKISPEINTFETEINGAKVTVQSLLTELGKVSTQSDFSVVNTKWRAFTEAAKSSGIAVRLIGDNSESSAHKIQKIAESLDTGAYSAKVDSIVAKTQKWTDANGNAKISTSSLQSALNALNTAYANMTTNSGNAEENQRALIEAEKALGIEIQSVTNKVNSMAANKATSSDIDTLRQKYQAFYDSNSAAHRQWGAQLKAGIAELAPGADIPIAKYRQLEQQLIQVGNAARQAGKLGKSWFDTLKAGAQKFSYWTSSTFLVTKAIQEIRQAVTFAKELDEALTNVNYTMAVTESQLKKIGESSVQMSKQLGTSTSNVLSAVKLYANAKETADSIIAKAQPAIMISNVTGMTGEQSAKMLQSVMNQFDMTQDDLMRISDTIQAVSQNMAYDFAAGIQEIAGGIERSGSVARSAGLELEEYVSMLGLVIEQTGQSGDTIGNAFKTIFQRITKASATEGTLAEDISKVEESLKAVNVQVRDSANEFRDMSDIMSDLGKVWNTLSSVEQSNISYQVAGIRQTNILKSLLESWKEYEAMVGKASDSAGTTFETQEDYAKSLEGQLGTLSSTWDSAVHNLFDADSLKPFITGLTKLGEGFEWVTEKAGLLGTISLGAGLFAGIKNFGRPKMFGLKIIILKLPNIISVLLDTKVFLWSVVKYTMVNAR